MAVEPAILTAGKRLAAALTVAAALTAPARAQSLQRLTVAQFTLAADTASPKLETPFHLIVTVHVRQRVGAIENLDLPILAELELLGDERRVTRETGGTVYREAIAVVAHHTGQIQIAPATLDAVDARDGKAKRYFSNDLTLDVAGGTLDPLRAAGTTAAAVMRLAFTILLWLFCAAAAIFILVVLYRRRRAQPPAFDPVPVQPLPIVRESDPRDALRDGLLTLRAERSRRAAVGVRTVARELVGANDTETLGDVLRRPGAHDARMRDVLRSLERAAFTYDTDLPAAIDAAIRSLEHALA